MRTTLAIDDDVLLAARHVADREGKTIGEVVSELARRGLGTPTRRATSRNGILLLPRRGGGKPVTLEMVNELRDEGA